LPGCYQQERAWKKKTPGEPVCLLFLLRVAVEECQISNSINLTGLVLQDQVCEFMSEITVPPGDRLVKGIGQRHDTTIRQVDGCGTEAAWLEFVQALQFRQRH